jgi:lipopolysaccharide heptosyltransferase II
MIGRTSAGAPPSWADARRILAIRLDAMGDVLMTTPALRAIRASRPDAHLALLTSPAGAPVARLIPELDETIVYEAPWLKPLPEGGPSASRDLAFISELSARRFDAAVIFTVHSQSALPAALACHLAAIPLRLAHVRENPYHLITDWVPEPEPDAPIRHEVRRQLDLVASVGYRTEDEHLSVRVPPDDARRVRTLVAALGLGEGPWLVAHPGASAPSRRYPAEGYIRALGTLAREDGWRVVVTGGHDEIDLAEDVRAGIGEGAVSLAGQLSVGELSALLALAPMLVANNTGPVHLAAAVGTPVVVLYALTNLQHTPWSVPSRVLSHDVPCKGCRKSVCPLEHNNCLRMVAPDAIVGAVRDLATEVRIADYGRGGAVAETGPQRPPVLTSSPVAAPRA